MRMSVEESFSLSWDNLIRGMTACVVVLVFTLAAILGLVLENLWLKIVIVLSLFCVFIIPLLWAPQRYLVKGNLVTVQRLVGDVRILVSREPERWKWTCGDLDYSAAAGCMDISATST